MRIIHILPELEGQELIYVQSLLEGMPDDQAKLFANIYRVRRKDPQITLLMGIIGLMVVPGLQRFYVGQIGMGILYLLTIGLCFIGSIVDLVNYKKISLEHNMRVAREALASVMADV